ncbi:MAG: hypothetical protein Q9169_000763 [Polycauliona sp. 2 TL-2023]
MTEELRSLVSEKLTILGVQLQHLWQEGCSLGQSFERSLSSLPPLPSSTALNISNDKANDDAPQGTILPISNALDFNTPGSVHRDAYRKDTANGHSQTESPDLSLPSSLDSDSDTPIYVNACTQTAPLPLHLTPATDHEDFQSDTGRSMEHLAEEEAPWAHGDLGVKVPYMPSGVVSDTHGDDATAPEVFDGPSHVVVGRHDGKEYLAMLVTKEMIERLKYIHVESDKLEHLEPQLLEIEQKVNLARLHMEWREEDLEDAQSQDQIDELREAITQDQSTLPEDEERLADLNEETSWLRDGVSYMEGLFAESCTETLVRGGVVELSKGSQEDGHDDEAQHEPADALDDYQYHTHQSDHSSVSIVELARRAAHEEVGDRFAELMEIEQEFDARQGVYEQQNARFQEMIREGTCTMTQTEFDHADFETTRGLTIDFREAEQRYEEALTRRGKFGPNDEQQDSDFIDDEDDGYPLSGEDDGIVYAPIARINKWLEGIPDALPDMEALEMAPNPHCEQAYQEGLQDCDIRSARMSDVYSCHDWTRNRRRIDRWRAIAGRDR